MTFTFKALGTTAVVAVTDPARRDDAVALVAAELAALDAACSRFREDSELTRVVRAAGRPVRVSTLLLEAIAVALDAARATGGLVDPTVGRSLRLAGYDATFRVIAARDGCRFHASFDRTPGWQVVELERSAGTVRVPHGVELDLGATAKAFASDRCARLAAEVCGCGVLVGLGGDISVAGETPSTGWPIGIADDHGGAHDETVAIHGGGLATSSTLVRRWRSGDTVLHHVIDPRTGRPADTCWRTVSVAATSCLDANVASTAAVILGAAAVPWLAERRLDARLVGVEGEITTVGRWPAHTAAAA